MNAKGSTVAGRLQNVPARVKELARFRAHEGAARAIVVISTMSGADNRQWEPVFPEWGARREAFEELVDDVSLDGVIGNLFGAESYLVAICNSLSGSFCKYNQ